MKLDRLQLSGTNLERAADHNQRVTLHAIRVHGSLTRVELARITGLTAPAIANITRRLIQDGYIQEAGQRRGARGQPPTRLVVTPAACYSVGVNIDRDHITIVVVDFVGQTVARVSREVDFPTPSQVSALYRRSIRSMLRSADIAIDKVIGIGIAIPDEFGLIDLPGRPADYAEWEHVDLKALFDEPFRLPVFFENDAAAAAMGEMQLGLGQTYGSFFYILISSGLGGGFVADGNYIRGANGRSGELGYMRAGGKGGREVQVLVSRSGLAHQLSEDGLTFTDLTGGDADPTLADSIARWIDAAADQLCGPLDAINCLINPAAVLVGGRLPAAILDRLTARAAELMARRQTHLPAIAPIVRAALSEDAPAVGAAILPFSHFLLPKAAALWKADAAAGIEIAA